jgi:hypothetical protein
MKTTNAKNVVGQLTTFKSKFHAMQHRSKAPDGHSQMNEGFTSTEPHHPEAQESIGPSVARLPGIATQLIGERMRAMYATMVREPVPDELMELVRQLEERSK